MNDQNNLDRQIDYLVAILIDFFRDPRSEAQYLSAAKIALNQVARAKAQPVDNLEKRFLFFASRLKNNISPMSIRSFAKSCIDASDKSLGKPSPKILETPKQLKKKAYQEIALAIARGESQETALNRAAHQLVRFKKKQDAAERKVRMAEEHPLSETFSALNSHSSKMPKEDIRQHLLNLKRKTESGSDQGRLFGLLKKAQAFSAPRVHALLGDELFFLCKPLGFLDRADQILLVEVPTSAHLHALTYRKLEVLMALKKDDNFRAVKNIRFKVAHSSF